MKTNSGLPTSTAVYLELGTKRVFACALDWPGWCRSGQDEGQALAALTATSPRYAAVALEAGVPFPAGTGHAFDVVERRRGSATTNFGAPGHLASRDSEPLTSENAGRLASLVAGSWAVFDRVVAQAPSELRKGPRGGGRNRDAIVEHVLGAEVMYARKLGIRLRQPAPGDVAAIATLRAEILAALRSAQDETSVVETGWPSAYAARRIAWHVIDHAWEIEDRAESPT